MSASYRNFLRLLEKWPVDANKKGRDLGEHLRQKISEAFHQGAATRVDEVACGKKLDSLTRLASNYYVQRHKRLHDSSASGLSAEKCGQIMSTEFINQLMEEEKGLLEKVMPKKFLPEQEEKS